MAAASHSACNQQALRQGQKGEALQQKKRIRA